MHLEHLVEFIFSVLRMEKKQMLVSICFYGYSFFGSHLWRNVVDVLNVLAWVVAKKIYSFAFYMKCVSLYFSSFFFDTLKNILLIFVVFRRTSSWDKCIKTGKFPDWAKEISQKLWNKHNSNEIRAWETHTFSVSDDNVSEEEKIVLIFYIGNRWGIFLEIYDLCRLSKWHHKTNTKAIN